MNLFNKTYFGKTKPKTVRLPKEWVRAMEDLADMHNVTYSDLVIECTKPLYASDLETPKELLFVREIILDFFGISRGLKDEKAEREDVTQITNLSNDIEQLKQVNKELSINLEREEQANKRLRFKIEELEEETTLKEQELTSSRREFIEVGERNKDLESKLDDAKNELDELTKKLTIIENNVANKESELQETKQELEDLKLIGKWAFSKLEIIKKEVEKKGRFQPLMVLPIDYKDTTLGNKIIVGSKMLEFFRSKAIADYKLKKEQAIEAFFNDFQSVKVGLPNGSGIGFPKEVKADKLVELKARKDVILKKLNKKK